MLIPIACAADWLFFMASMALPVGLFIIFIVKTIIINKTASIKKNIFSLSIS